MYISSYWKLGLDQEGHKLVKKEDSVKWDKTNLKVIKIKNLRVLLLMLLNFAIFLNFIASGFLLWTKSCL